MGAIKKYLFKRNVTSSSGDVRYGYLYNRYALENIAKPGWHVATEQDFLDLMSGGYQLKEPGYWEEPNIGDVNDAGFNGRGGGNRDFEGNFDALGLGGYYWCGDSVKYFYLTNSLSDGIIGNAYNEKYGLSVKVVKDTTDLTHGQTGTYVGNDGRVYPTICIDNLEWLAVNLAETKDNTGATIPEITDNDEWMACGDEAGYAVGDSYGDYTVWYVDDTTIKVVSSENIEYWDDANDYWEDTISWDEAKSLEGDNGTIPTLTEWNAIVAALSSFWDGGEIGYQWSDEIDEYYSARVDTAVPDYQPVIKTERLSHARLTKTISLPNTKGRCKYDNNINFV